MINDKTYYYFLYIFKSTNMLSNKKKILLIIKILFLFNLTLKITNEKNNQMIKYSFNNLLIYFLK